MKLRFSQDSAKMNDSIKLLWRTLLSAELNCTNRRLSDTILYSITLLGNCESVALLPEKGSNYINMSYVLSWEMKDIFYWISRFCCILVIRVSKTNEPIIYIFSSAKTSQHWTWTCLKTNQPGWKAASSFLNLNLVA